MTSKKVRAEACRHGADTQGLRPQAQSRPRGGLRPVHGGALGKGELIREAPAIPGAGLNPLLLAMGRYRGPGGMVRHMRDGVRIIA